MDSNDSKNTSKSKKSISYATLCLTIFGALCLFSIIIGFLLSLLSKNIRNSANIKIDEIQSKILNHKVRPLDILGDRISNESEPTHIETDDLPNIIPSNISDETTDVYNEHSDINRPILDGNRLPLAGRLLDHRRSNTEFFQNDLKYY